MEHITITFLEIKKSDTSYAKRKEFITEKVIEVFHESKEVYGARKIEAVLKNRGIITSAKYISKIMKENNLVSIRTNAKKDFKKLNPKECHLKCNFKTNAPNQIWVSDTLYLPYKGRFYYICVVMDLYSRKIIAYKISEKHTTNLVSATFKNAYISRNSPENLIFHSDRGSQYTSTSFQKLLISNGVTQSFSPKGSPTNNGVVESFFSIFKLEEFYRNKYPSFAKLKKSVNDYIENYNDVRPHGSLKFKTPTQYECTNYTVQN